MGKGLDGRDGEESVGTRISAWGGLTKKEIRESGRCSLMPRLVGSKVHIQLCVSEHLAGC